VSPTVNESYSGQRSVTVCRHNRAGPAGADGHRRGAPPGEASVSIDV
jgi:hypothetical protein